MRKIKFKVWDKQKNKMFLPDGKLYAFNGIEVSRPELVQEFNVDSKGWEGASKEDLFSEDTILLQYTGFTDRNGKEVYEGDILGLYFPSSPTGHRQNPIKEVVFLDGAFCLKGYNKEFDYDRDFGMPSNMMGSGNPWVIISNIFEYKESQVNSTSEISISDIIKGEFDKGNLTISEYKKISIFLDTFPSYKDSKYETPNKTIFNKSDNSRIFTSFNRIDLELTIFLKHILDSY